MFVWALLGMEIFAYRIVMDENENLVKTDEAADLLSSGTIQMIRYPRENFNDIWSSLISVYILIVGEDWNVLMNMYARTFERNDYGGKWIPELYCMTGIIMGNLTLLALLTGMLTIKNSEVEEIKDQSQLPAEKND